MLLKCKKNELKNKKNSRLQPKKKSPTKEMDLKTGHDSVAFAYKSN